MLSEICQIQKKDIWSYLYVKSKKVEYLETEVELWPGEFHEQRSLAGCSPWGPKELNMTEQLSLFQAWGGGRNGDMLVKGYKVM